MPKTFKIGSWKAATL